MAGPAPFDGPALFAALDAQRSARGLGWAGVARELWELSAELNEQRTGDHPFSASTLTHLGERGATSCQHALFVLRWLDRCPEEFLRGPGSVTPAPLPACGPDRRPRWHLHATERRPAPGLYEAMRERRVADGLTWADLATTLRCGPNQLSGLRTARYATSMGIAMGVAQWLRRPAAEFIYPARW